MLFGAASDSLKTSITGIMRFSGSVSGLRTASLAAYVMFVVMGELCHLHWWDITLWQPVFSLCGKGLWYYHMQLDNELVT